MVIDLNCDIGESFGIYKLGCDEEILNYVSSVSIACGFYGGDPTIMHKAVKKALLKDVAIGAHPGFYDLMGFGRRNINITPQEAYDMVLYQIGALNAFVKAEGGKMQHVKPHGALYNMAGKDKKLAKAIAKAVYDLDSNLILYGLAGSELIKQGELIGLKTVSEVVADRTYQYDGSLTPRNQSDALVKDKEEALERVKNMIKYGKVKCQQGYDIDIKVDTICIHGDNEESIAFAKLIYTTLVNAGIEILPFNKI